MVWKAWLYEEVEETMIWRKWNSLEKVKWKKKVQRKKL